MEWLTDAHWVVIGVIIGSVLTGVINYVLQKSQFKHNKEMFRLQNRSKEMVKEILIDMLNHRTHTDRSFVALKKRIGGFSDDEIKQILHEIGAKKTIRKDDKSEWWYLKEREQERIEKRNTP
ncbi:MAG: hypothetical protein JJU13_19235 [Balneolaceae bacterium]|nr:hypothetical protein [Balneolaceae bacterium]